MVGPKAVAVAVVVAVALVALEIPNMVVVVV